MSKKRKINKKQKNLYYGLAGLGVAAVTVTLIAVPLAVRNNKSTTTSAVTEAKAKLGDIELSAWDLPAGTDEATRAAIINELVANGKLTLSDSTINAGADSKATLATSTPTTAKISALKFDQNTLITLSDNTIKATVYDALVTAGATFTAGIEAKDGEYNAIYDTIDAKTVVTAPAQPTDGTAHSSLTSSLFTPGKAATNGEYAASYNNTPVNITVTAPSAPANGTEVAGETDSSKFVAGTAAVTGNNGTAGVWTVKYATTAIPSLEVTVQNTGTTLGTALSDQTASTGFNSSTYSEGKAHEAEVIPSPSAIDIDKLNKGDTVTIGSDTYKVEEAISYPSIKGPYYATGTANSFVTDVTKADGYTSQKNPSPETFATDGTVPTLIINGIKYTWVQSDAPLEFTTDSVEIYI